MCALFAALTFKHLHLRELSTSPLEISLMLVFSYMPYLLAASMRLSGIMAIFVGGVMMSHYTQWNLSDEARIVTASMFKTLAFAAETFLFAYIGLSAVTFEYTNAVPLALGGLALCLLGRALNIFPLSLIVNQFRSKRISYKVQFVLWFSGLRGIISFALALNVPGADHDVIAAATLIIVMLTIIIFGGGTVPVLRSLNMIKETKAEKDARSKQEHGTDPEDMDGGGSAHGASSSGVQSKLLDPERSDTHTPNVRTPLKRTPTGKNWFERLDEKMFLPIFRHPDATHIASVEDDSDADD